jgi:hypothetical protein
MSSLTTDITLAEDGCAARMLSLRARRRVRLSLIVAALSPSHLMFLSFQSFWVKQRADRLAFGTEAAERFIRARVNFDALLAAAKQESNALIGVHH